MHHSIHSRRMISARLLALAILGSGGLVAGCGGSSPSQTIATARTSRSGTASNGAATTRASSTAASLHASSTGSTAPGTGRSGSLAFARCMRAHGVSNFPDPNPGGGSAFNMAGIDTSAPVFMAAQAKCHRLMGGGPPGPGSTTHPSEQTLVKLRKIGVCLRAHGISDFPDPRTTVPSNPGPGIAEITDFDGVILLFPAKMNLQAPAYKRALAACGAPPLGLPH